MSNGEYQEAALGEEYADPKIMGCVVSNWMNIAKGTSTVIFTPTRANAADLVVRFKAVGVTAEYLDAHTKAHNDNKYDLLRRVLPMDDVTYCFLFQDGPRERRIAMLSAICQIARVKSPENKKVIGIATEKKIRPTCSYDFCLVNIPELTEEYQKYIDELQKDTGILTNPIFGYTHEEEYPKSAKD